MPKRQTYGTSVYGSSDNLRSLCNRKHLPKLRRGSSLSNMPTTDAIAESPKTTLSLQRHQSFGQLAQERGNMSDCITEKSNSNIRDLNFVAAVDADVKIPVQIAICPRLSSKILQDSTDSDSHKDLRKIVRKILFHERKLSRKQWKNKAENAEKRCPIAMMSLARQLGVSTKAVEEAFEKGSAQEHQKIQLDSQIGKYTAQRNHKAITTSTLSPVCEHNRKTYSDGSADETLSPMVLD